MAEFVPGVLVDIRGHVAVEHPQRLLKGLITQRKFVVLLPQVGFEDFHRRKKPQDSGVSGGKSAAESRGPSNGPGCQRGAGWQQRRTSQTKALHECPPREISVGVACRFFFCAPSAILGRVFVYRRVLHIRWLCFSTFCFSCFRLRLGSFTEL